jgi:FlaA1/EpsC-like NDP-sugar epimerase
MAFRIETQGTYPMLHQLAVFSQPVLSLPRVAKRIIALCVDTSFCVLAVWLAYYLRLGEFRPLTANAMVPVFVSFALAIPIFIISGLYRAIFRYSGMPAMISVARAIGIYGLLYASLFTAIGVEGVPRTIGLIQPMLMLMFVGTSRVFVKIWLGSEYQSRLKLATLPQALIYGAGSAGRQLANAMSASHEIRVVGYLDDDDRLHGHVLNGLPIFAPEDLPGLVDSRNITDVLMALPSVSRQRRNAILAQISPLRLAVRTLPAMTDLVTGKVSMSDVRDLDIDDLLGREPVKPNALLLNRNTHNKTVLVTGAGGSIGSELCRQILQSQPKQLLLVEMSEFALYQIHQELQSIALGGIVGPQQAAGVEAALKVGTVSADAMPTTEIVPLLASVCDEVRMQEIMDTWRPHTVYHAAAYKHVPLVEHNPAEGVHNNVWGTRVCAEAALRNGVRNFVLISTDKAVRPTNIMGATKRLAEMVLQALAELNPAVTAQGGMAPTSRTCFSMVRFGNVLGSSGSVVPLFREQIRNGGPITLTHPDITRFFMTIPEAAQLVIQAGAMGTGGDVFVLDMGQPVRIMDLARRMVELSGLSVRDADAPDGDIEITITGLRPGEKLYEELLIGENPIPTQHSRIMKAQEPFRSWNELQESLYSLRIATSTNDAPLIRGLLQQLVSGYQPSGEVVDWVYLAQEREALGTE